MGIFKTVLKSIVMVIGIVFAADVAAISIDKLLVEWRVLELRNDIADVAKRNNGVPELYIERFEQRAETIAERSFLVDRVATNINYEIGDYQIIGMYGDDAVPVYENGDLMYIVVAVQYSYGSLLFQMGDYWDGGGDDLVTVNEIGEWGSAGGQTGTIRDSPLRFESTEVRIREATALRYLK